MNQTNFNDETVSTNSAITQEKINAFLAKRDLAVDLVRTSAVLLVVIIHSLMVGIAVSTQGVQVTDPAQSHNWFHIASWFAQIMPLFFIVGGFSSWQGWESTQRKGGGAKDFLRTRLFRLAYPALVWYLIIGAALWACAVAGLPKDLLNELAGGLGMPLWFLSAYLICQLLVPVMANLHKRYRYKVLLVLFALCVVVDAARYATGITELGLINLVFLWPLCQQLGFFYADGTLQKLSRRLLIPFAVIAFIIVGLSGYVGPYSLDMLDNLNPPTVPLIFIGLAHLALFLRFKPQLDALMHKKVPQRVMLFLGSRAMTIYLWHLLVVILLNALVLVIPSLPQPDTAAWWLTRTPSILLTFGIIIIISLPLAKLEAGPAKKLIGAVPPTWVIVMTTIMAIIPPFVAMEFKLDLDKLAWGCALLFISIALSLNPERKVLAKNKTVNKLYSWRPRILQDR